MHHSQPRSAIGRTAPGRTKAGRSATGHHRLIAAAIALIFCLPAGAPAAGEVLERTTEGGLPYTVALPAGYTAAADAEHPLLLFLHGGDRSNTRHHPKRYAEAEGIDFPFVVVAPHCARGCSWQTTDFDALLREVTAEHRIDHSRIYLTGYSMGGYGSGSALARSPQWFAAAAPICGGGDPATICAAKDVAIRAYHGDEDRVIPHSSSVTMVEALEACEGEVTLVTLEGMDHAAWIPTFKDPEFYRWLLSHRKGDAL